MTSGSCLGSNVLGFSFAGIVVASTAAAPLGARLAHRLSEALLRRILAVFVALLGLRMLWGLVR